MGGYLSALSNKFLGNKKGFSITEVLIALGVIAVIAVLIFPVITTRAQNKSFALSYETEVKQMLNSLEGLPANENKEDITNTMMYVETDTGNYADNSGAYINKYMKVVKYCGNEPGDCFGGRYYEYRDNDRVEFDISDIKGACALLKNGVSICLKPQIKKAGGVEEIQGWIDLNGPKGPNIYGRDLRTFEINLKQGVIFTEEEPTRVIVPDPPTPCEGDDCGEIEKDPCKVYPKSEECCKRDGFVASGKDDICCPWYRDASTGPNHLICNPDAASCDPDTDPNCKIDECTNHTITGPADECCAILEAQGKHDPNCCAPNAVSDYCCSVHPETEGCCKKNIESGKLRLTADSNCCKYPAIYNEFLACKPACEQNNDSEQCCNTVARRNKISNPDDACCKYEGVNGLGEKSGNNPYNKYCCRLPINASKQCCKWKYDHIGSNLDYYTKHDYRVNDGIFDGCCHDDIYGIKSENNDVLSRCCTLNQAQSNTKEDELCCDYFLSKLDGGDDNLKADKPLRRCCKHEKYKNKPQCCSSVKDGELAFEDEYVKQCCMPNSIYENPQTLRVECCFDHNPDDENTKFWNGSRWDGCCMLGENTYNGHKANTEGQWQKNCCKLTRAKYPSEAAYNAACCTENATAKDGNRDSWQYFSATKNECCEILDNQSHKSRDEYWQSHCCYGYEGGNLTTNNPYYETEQKCCKIDGNWTEGCCTKSGLDNKDDKWKKNCCSLPTKYSNNAEYRQYCCGKDYTRNSKADDNNYNTANTNTDNNKEYCCDPDIADHPSITDSGNRYTWNTSNTPKKECCDYFAGRDWMTNDNNGTKVSKYYKAACCQHYGHKGGLNCEELWMCGLKASYGIPGGSEGTCCGDVYTDMKKDVTDPNVWRPGCCDFPTKYTSFSIYRASCCSSTTDYTRTGKGNTDDNKQYCCIPNGVTINRNTDELTGILPTKECCEAFKAYDTSNTGAWKSHDGETINDAYKIACCKFHGVCPDGEDACKIRRRTNDPSKYRNQYCCTNVPTSKDDLDNIGVYCDCTTAANTWKVVNTKYEKADCCVDVGVLSKASASITKNAQTRAHWQGNCCAKDSVHKNTLDPVRSAHYLYCCGGPNAEDKSNWLNSTCCASISNNASKQGLDWKNNWESACCYYDDKDPHPTEFCCNAKYGSGTGKGVNPTTRDTGYKLACCNTNNNYCSCATKLDKNLTTSDTCCKALKDTENTKYRWQADCCKYRTNYPTQDDYRTKCCKSDGVNKDNNPNDAIYCCNPGNGSPSKNCCSAFQANNWKDWDGNPISEDYRINCCDEQGVCDDCVIRGKTGNPERYDLPNCCKATQSLLKNDLNWQKKCCDAAPNVPNATSSRNTLTDDEFRTYCCSGTSEATKMPGQSDWRCCTAPADKKWKTSFCCKNKPYQKADHCTCADAATIYNIVNGTGCCGDETVVNRVVNTGGATRTNWISKCCSGANKGESYTTANWVTPQQFKSYCCNPTSSNNTGATTVSGKLSYGICCDSYTYGKGCCKSSGVKWDGTNLAACCNYSGAATANATCCDAAKAAGWTNNAYGGSAYREKCCTLDTKYCTCADAATIHNIVNGTECCGDSTVLNRVAKTGGDTRTDWINKCCTLANNNTTTPEWITRSQFKSYCCDPSSNYSTGKVKPSGTNFGICCDTYVYGQACCMSSGVRWDGRSFGACCDFNGPANGLCCNWAEGYGWTDDYGGSAYREKCCSFHSAYCACDYDGDANETCCETAKDNNWAYEYGGYGYRRKCCKKWQKYCDCKLKLEEHNGSFNDVGCCRELYNDTSNRQKYLKDNNYINTCCKENNPGEFSQSDFKQYCCLKPIGDGRLHTYGNHEWCCNNNSNTKSVFCCEHDFTAQCPGGGDTPGGGGGEDPVEEDPCIDNFGNTKKGNQNTECCSNDADDKDDEKSEWCCKQGKTNQCTCQQKWVASCCNVDNINSAPDEDKKSCCVRLYEDDPNSQLFQGANATCCQALDTDEDGKSTYNNKIYPGCKAGCALPATYSTGRYPSNKATQGSAAYCCDRGYGLVGNDPSSTTWKKYCCGTYHGSSWNFPTSNTKYIGCCDYIKTSVGNTSVWWYDPTRYNGTCDFGGEANKCSDYSYSGAGFYCGPEDKCKAWRFQGGSEPDTLSTCCDNLKSWGSLDGSYKTTCCGNKTFRESANGKEVCCNAWKSGNYTPGTTFADTFVYSCCNYFHDSTVSSDTNLKNKCCDNSSWAQGNPGVCCDLGSVQNKYLGKCCAHWKNNSQTLFVDKCCADYFDSNYCCCSIPSGITNITTEEQRECCLSLAQAKLNEGQCKDNWHSVCCNICSEQPRQEKYNPIYELCNCGSTGGSGSGGNGNNTKRIIMKCTSPTVCSCYAEYMSSVPTDVYCSVSSTCGGGNSSGSCSVSYSRRITLQGLCVSSDNKTETCHVPDTSTCICTWALNYCAILQDKGNGIWSILKECPISNDHQCECSITSW